MIDYGNCIAGTLPRREFCSKTKQRSLIMVNVNNQTVTAWHYLLRV